MKISPHAKSHAAQRSLLVCLATCALMLALSATRAADVSPPRMTGMFTDMTYNEEGGDVNGIEVFLVYSNRGYFAVYQSSEGEPSVPVVVPAKVQGTMVTFQVPPTVDARGTFTGTVIDNELSGTFSGNGQAVHLKRKPSYWQ